jgi:hypothetical protein
MLQTPQRESTFGNLAVQKAMRISISKWKNHLSVLALLEVEMFKKCMRLWCEARFEVKMLK